MSFAILGIYLGFQMVVLAALRARLKGWTPTGEFTLGRWGLIINVLALAYGVVAIVNIVLAAHPGRPLVRQLDRDPERQLVVGIGLVYMFIAKPFGHSDAPAGDAVGPLRPERV